MKNLRRTFIFVLCFMSLCSFAYSRTIEATGYASSAQGAQDAALQKLTEQIFGTMVQNVTTISSRDDGEKSSSEYGSSFNSISFGKLFGVEYSSAKKIDKSNYEVTASIDDANSVYYVDELNNISEKIKNAYNRNTDTLEEKRDKLVELLSLVTEFENLKQVLIAMRLSTQIPEMPIAENYHSISTQLSGVYTEMTNNAEERKKSGTQSSIASIDSLIEQLRAEQDALAISSERALMEQRSMYEKSIMESIESMIVSTHKDDSLLTVNGYSLKNDIDVLNEIFSSYNQICAQMENQLASVTAKNRNEVQLGVKSIKNKAYSLAETTKTGIPTTFAKAAREDEIDDFKMAKQSELDSQKALIVSMYESEIQRCYDEMVRVCREIENRTYTLTDANGEIDWMLEGYDGEAAVWALFINTEYVGNHNIDLPYKSVSGKDAVAYQKNNKKAFENYKIAVEQYTDSLPELVSFSISVDVIVDAISGQLRIEGQGIKVYISNRFYTTMPLSPSVFWVDLKNKANDISYAFLKMESSFNKKADGIRASQQAQEERARQEAAAREEEKRRLEIKAQTKANAINLNAQFYGVKRQFVVLPEVRIETGSAVVNDVPHYCFGFNIGVDIEYTLSRFFYVGCEPFYSSGNLSDSDDNNTSYNSFGVLLNGGVYLTDFLGVGARLGASTSGIMVNGYGKFNLGALLSEMEIVSNELPLIMDLGFAYDSLAKRTCFTMGVGYAF